MQPTGFPYGKEVISYNGGELLSPYMQKNQIVDGQIGYWIIKACFWRKCFFISSGFVLFLSLIFIMLLNSSPFSIMVEEVSNTGFLKRIGVLDNYYRISDQMYESYLKELFIKRMQTKSLKAQNWVRDVSSPEAYKILSTFVKSQNENSASFTINSFQINTIGKFDFLLNYTQSNGFARSFNITGVVVNKTPQEHRVLMKNPLGFYLLQISIKSIKLNVPISETGKSSLMQDKQIKDTKQKVQ